MKALLHHFKQNGEFNNLKESTMRGWVICSEYYTILSRRYVFACDSQMSGVVSRTIKCENPVLSLSQIFYASKISAYTVCQTRWIEKHDTFAVFVDILKPFVDFLKPFVVCLDNINSIHGRAWNRENPADAYSLLLALQKFSFVVCLIVAREILLITKPLSSQLQRSYTDIARAHHNIDQAKRQVRQNHDDLNKFHTLVYNKACDVTRDISRCATRGYVTYCITSAAQKQPTI